MREDAALHITIMAGEARAVLCETTAAAQTAMDIHQATRTCAAALGRGLSAAVLLASTQKSGRLTATFRGGGPAGALVAVAAEGVLKATIDDPSVKLPPKANGKLDVGGAIGSDGRVTVVRDLGLREPYVGQSAMASGEIAEDLALYCTVSEQQPTLCALGVLVGERVTASGGLLIQPLPGCSEETLSALELRAPVYANISALLEREPPEELAHMLFDGLQPEVIERVPLAYRCDCTRGRMERALISMGRDELESMIHDQGGAELICHFCRSAYAFDAAQLRALMKEQD